MITLYHYTDSDGYRGIQSSRTIHKATRHAFHGSGVYFNSRRIGRNGVTREDVAYDNYRGGDDANIHWGYLDYVVEVDFPSGDVTCADAGRNLWLYPTDDHLDLTKYTHRFYSV